MLSAFVNTDVHPAASPSPARSIIGSMTAYAIDRFTFRFKKLVVALFLVATLVPGVTTQVATFQIVNSFGLFDTRWAPIVLYMGTDIVSIYIFLQFIRSHPDLPGRGRPAGRRQRLHDLPADHLPAAEARDRDGRHHQGDHRLQRLLHPVPLHAVRGSRRDLDVPVPLQGPVRRALGGRSRPARSS